MSSLTRTYNADVVVEPSVSILGRDLVELSADLGTSSSVATSVGNAVGFAGQTDSESTASVSTHAKVDVQSDGNGADAVHIKTAQLNVSAQGVGNLSANPTRNVEAIDIGSSTRTARAADPGTSGQLQCRRDDPGSQRAALTSAPRSRCLYSREARASTSIPARQTSSSIRSRVTTRGP